MPKLVIRSSTAPVREFELKAGANSVGRDAANDFKIDDPSVSGFHARIIVDDGSVLIKDLDSTNGTFILHTQVKEGVLQPGQFIRLGNVYLVFEADSPASRVVPGAAPVVVPMVAAPNAGQGRTGGPTLAPSGGGLKIAGFNRATAAATPPVSESAATSARPGGSATGASDDDRTGTGRAAGGKNGV